MASDVQADLAGLQEALLTTDGVEQFLHELAVLAAASASDGIGSADAPMSCGTALRHRGRPEPVTGCSDPVACDVDRVQYQEGEGPTLHTLRHGRPVRVHDTAGQDRWPRFGRRAASLGVRSCCVVPLFSEGEAAGALTLYAREPGTFDQALGVIMATERCPQDKAFELLRNASQDTNVKLRDLAATIVTDVSGEPPRPTAPFENGSRI